MMKRSLILCSFCVSVSYYAQIGIGTTSPQAVFHIDGTKDNPTTGSPTIVQQANDFVVASTGNVGIGIINPQKPLDVDAKNSSLRIRNLTRQLPDSYDVLTRDIGNGDVYASSYSYSSNVTVQPGASVTVTTPPIVNIPRGFLVVKSTNECSRTMITNFVYSGLSLAYVSGIARDKTANATIAPIAAGMNTSGTWNVTFSNVAPCGDGGGSTQFDFTVMKLSTSSYRITNNGNITRAYRLAINRL